ncbi:TPA: hypothetical protein HA265_05715 [Candidatus Woesearchaeota archaeon]|nr:hypothetical protein [Candidatus Woesearchaeota archaeon]
MFTTGHYNLLDDLIERYVADYDATVALLDSGPSPEQLVPILDSLVLHETTEPDPLVPESRLALRNYRRLRKRFFSLDLSSLEEYLDGVDGSDAVPPDTVRHSAPVPSDYHLYLLSKELQGATPDYTQRLKNIMALSAKACADTDDDRYALSMMVSSYHEDYLSGSLRRQIIACAVRESLAKKALKALEDI